ncbi:MAG: hypothetical protein R3C68_17935 [Myxococcota bacterium]
MVQPIFNTEEKILLTQAIAAAETNTRAEIVPVVVRTSDTYPGARWRLAVVVMLISTAALAWLLPNITPELLLALLLPLLLLGHLLATPLARAPRPEPAGNR